MWIRKRGELYTGTAWADCTSILCRNARKESDWMAIHLAIQPSKSNTFKREQAIHVDSLFLLPAANFLNNSLLPNHPVHKLYRLFERVQMRVEKNKRTPARAKAEEEYLLTTKLFCGHCGRMMIGESGKSHTGAIYRYYKCSGAKRKLGCRKKAVKKDWIECIAVQYTIQRVFQDELIAQIADKLVELQNTEDNTLPLLRKQLADTNRGIENMLNAIQQGILTNSTKERLEELEKLLEDLKASILQAELERPKYSREDIIEWISRFKYGDPSNKEYQRQIIDIFLNSIYVFDDRLVFTYNYKNGTQTVSLADVSAAFGSDLKSCTPPQQTDPAPVPGGAGAGFLFFRGK